MTPFANAIPLLIALVIGASVAVIVWLTTRSIAEVPEQDRTYLDPPPAGFRLLWWPIQWIAYYTGVFLTVRNRQRIAVKLRKAGLDFSVSPEQYVAAQVMGAVVAGLLAWWVMATLGFQQWTLHLCVALFGYAFPALWLSDRIKLRQRELFKALPFYLDIITLCVEAGLNLQGAINQAVQKGPKGVMRDELQKVLRDIRAGKPRAESLRAMAQRLNEPSITNLVSALIQAENLGMSLGPVLRAQAEQRRTERFLRAEKLAMEAPVKMLLPLIAFIFPCTFIVLGFPIVMKFLSLDL